MKPLLLLGGYGSVGRHLARRLLRDTPAPLIIAGRRREKCEQLTVELNREFPGDRVGWCVADADRMETVRPALAEARMVVIGLPTTERSVAIAREALAVGTDYLDMHFPPHIVPALRELDSTARDRGRCFITQAGFHPGLLAPLVNASAPHFARMHRADLALSMRFRFPPDKHAAADIMSTVERGGMQVYEQGRWREAGVKDCRTFDFGPGIGTRVCAPLNFPELHPLPERHGLQSLGCYAAGFNSLVDRVLFPLGWILSRLGTGLAPRLLGPWLVWGVNRYAQPPWGVILRLQAEGEFEGQPQTCTIELRHPDVWEFTALAVVACLRQYLDGSSVRPGVWMMGELVDPGRTLEELQHLGVEVTVSTPHAPALPAQV